MNNNEDEKRLLEILFMEDSPMDADLIYEYLCENFQCEIQVDIVTKKEEFVSAISLKKYDLILADFMLPDFNGFAALAHIKAISPATPFICVSGFMGEETAVELLKQGATDYVSKDKLGRLKYSIERALKESKEKEEKEKRAAELVIANKELVFQNEEKDKRAAELVIANKELTYQNEEKADRAAELVIANKELVFQDEEKADRAAELVIANKELAFQGEEKADRAAELVIANKELVFQDEEKADRAAELVIANKELVFQDEERADRAAELVIANKELTFQNEEKEKRAAELVIANKELVIQNEEKEKRAAELVIANKELVIQNEEKEKRAAELVIANKELAFQNEEKADRAAELVIANKELVFQNEEKEKRAAELVIANRELAFQNQEKADRAAELILANAYLENLINYANASIIVLDPNLHITHFNHAVEFITGRSEKEVLGKSLTIVFPPDQASKSMKFFKNLQKEKRWETLEIEIIHVDGAIRTLLWNSAIIYDSDGITPVSIIAQGQDITDRKKAQEANHAKSQFLANMSHEIRTPMNAIMGLTYLIGQTDLNDSQKNYVSKIEGASTTLLRIINDILDFSKIEAGKLEIENIKFNIDMVLENVSNLYTISATNKGIDINFDTLEAVPEVLIGDPLRLEQIISNLTTNAIKFTSQGEVNVAVRVLAETEDKVKLHFSVTDTGIGLTKEQIERLFTAFTQADGSTTRKYGGTGLGLTISKQLVELMNGEIWVESVYGEGSSFQFVVPFDKAVDLIKPNYAEYPELQGKKVLVVDHNKTSLMILERMLSSFSFEVTALRNPFEAIELLQKEDFDLLVIDFNLPELSGIDLYKRLVANTEITVPKTIFVSATGRESYYNQVSQVGVKNFLVKPINQSLMFDAVMNVLKGTAWSQATKDQDEKGQIKCLWALADIHVLLVEDNDINQLVAKDILEQVGIRVSIANNGEEAIELVRANKFDVVLMDVQMPIMDGYKATEILRKTYSKSELPILAMTANALRGDRERSIESGMNDYISKPIDTAQLFQTMAHWIKKEKRSSSEKAYAEAVPCTSTNEALARSNGLIPELLGIDVQTALSRLGGNQKLYFKLLVKFSKNHEQASKEIRAALDKDDLKTAGRLAHTIKGAAGNVGAQAVYLAADALEDEFRDNKTENAEPLLEQFEQALKQILASIALLEENVEDLQSSDPGGADPSLLKPILAKLEKLLRDNDMDAAECVEEIVRQAKNTAFAEKAAELKDYVDQYNFEGALGTLNELLKIIGEVSGDEKENTDRR